MPKSHKTFLSTIEVKFGGNMYKTNYDAIIKLQLKTSQDN